MSELISYATYYSFWLFDHAVISMTVLIAATMIYTFGFTRGSKIR